MGGHDPVCSRFPRARPCGPSITPQGLVTTTLRLLLWQILKVPRYRPLVTAGRRPRCPSAGVLPLTTTTTTMSFSSRRCPPSSSSTARRLGSPGLPTSKAFAPSPTLSAFQQWKSATLRATGRWHVALPLRTLSTARRMVLCSSVAFAQPTPSGPATPKAAPLNFSVSLMLSRQLGAGISMPSPPIFTLATVILGTWKPRNMSPCPRILTTCLAFGFTATLALASRDWLAIFGLLLIRSYRTSGGMVISPSQLLSLTTSTSRILLITSRSGLIAIRSLPRLRAGL